MTDASAPCFLIDKSSPRLYSYASAKQIRSLNTAYRRFVNSPAKQKEDFMRIFILCLFLVLTSCVNAFCHSPSDMSVTFRDGGFDVVVSHSVSSPTSHYVKKIVIVLNGEKAAEKDFATQTDGSTQQASFDIPALKKGDLVEITAYCSRMGSLNKSVEVK